MPWRNLPPDWLAATLDAIRNSEFWRGAKAFIAMFTAAGIGAMAKVAGEVKRGQRPKFFSAQLWLDVPAVLMLALIAIGLASYYDLTGPMAAGLSTMLGYIGPRVVDTLILRKWGK